MTTKKRVTSTEFSSAVASSPGVLTTIKRVDRFDQSARRMLDAMAEVAPVISSAVVVALSALRETVAGATLRASQPEAPHG